MPTTIVGCLRISRDALERDGADRAAYLDAACGGDAALRREVETLMADPPPAPAQPARHAALGGAGARDGPPARPVRNPRACWAPAAWARSTGPATRGSRTGRRQGPVGRQRDRSRGPGAVHARGPGRRRAQPSRTSAPFTTRAETRHDWRLACGARGAARASTTSSWRTSRARPWPQRLEKRRRSRPSAAARPRPSPSRTQIADALAAAHQQGIVHRDLKPANVMLTTPAGRSGAPRVKLLDFGLAKFTPRARRWPAAVPRSPAPGAATTPGALMGTVPYMAPEQLEGKEVDARADIFSFGCVLYEMLAGRRAFAGETRGPASSRRS